TATLSAIVTPRIPRSSLFVFQAERVLDMQRRGAAVQQNRIAAQHVAVRRPRVARHPLGRRAGDAAALALANRAERDLKGGARLHLDEGDRAVALGDDVDLAAANGELARQDAIALRRQMFGGARLRTLAERTRPQPASLAQRGHVARRRESASACA